MPKLTPREVECLQWVSKGMTAAETAAQLNLSERTVEHYLESATQKLGAQNRTQAVAIALREKLINGN